MKLLLLLLITPLLCSVVVFIKRKKITKNTETALLGTFFTVVVPLIFIGGLALCMKGCNMLDVEYKGYYITGIRYVSPWEEVLTLPDGTKRVVEHGIEYYKINNLGEVIGIDGSEFEGLRYFWGSPKPIMTIKGIEYLWPGTKETMVTYTTEGYYKNMVPLVKTPYKDGLFHYPKISRGGIQHSILGGNPSAIDFKALDYINGRYGADYQFRTYLLIFDGTKYDKSIAQKQASYWQGGNKNEFNVCIGIDPCDSTVSWVHCFSWTPDSTIIRDTEKWITGRYKFRIPEYADFLESELKSGRWVRREFSNFGESVPIDLGKLFWPVILFGCIIALFIYLRYEDE